MSASTLVIVPCASAKVWDRDPDRGATPAKDAYTSPMFRVNRRYAERFADRWVILSAKYGFIDPDFMLPGPYNVSFNDHRTNPVAAVVLVGQVEDLALWRAARVVGLGGALYRRAVSTAFAGRDLQLEFPFAGLDMFHLLSATKAAVEQE